MWRFDFLKLNQLFCLKVCNKSAKKPSSPAKATAPKELSSHGERTVFEPQPDGRMVSKTFRNGKRVFEIVFSEYGAPQKGMMFSESGKLIREFEYGPDGQVK